MKKQERLEEIVNRNKELEYASKHNGELNEFLRKRKLPPNTLGRHVVEVVMDYVKELEKENDLHEQRMKDYHLQAVRNGTKLDEYRDEINRLELQNKQLTEGNQKIKDGNFGLSKIINSKREELKQVKEAYEDRLLDINILEEQIKRYEDILEFYADESNWDYELNSNALEDGGEKARQALQNNKDNA